MMKYISPEGHNWGPIFLDALGLAYIVVIIAWSLFVLCGLLLTVLKRALPFIRMRSLTLIASTLVSLHVYLVMTFPVYSLNGTFSCEAEFWVMSVYLPFGIACFHVQNMQLYSLSRLQRQLISSGPTHSATTGQNTNSWFGGLVMRFRRRNALQQTRILTYVGMGLQLVVSLVIYLLSRKFHGFGVVSHKVSPQECRQGWEWVPSVVWQFLWTYGFGPFVLFKIRGIHDIHYWKLQTSLAILASLPGSPLWLVAVYSDKFSSINKYWPPPMWFVPGLMTMEFVTVFFPLLEAYRPHRSRRSFVAAISDSENNQHPRVQSTGSNSANPVAVSHDAPSTAVSRRTNDLYSMDSLNTALRTNVGPLLAFATLRDFTGENIVFLNKVAEFKDAWERVVERKGTITAESRRELFDQALEIYANFICLRISQTPINIGGPMRLDIKTIFGPAAKHLQRKVSEDVVAPFASDETEGAWSLTNFQQQPNRGLLRSDSQEGIVEPAASSSASGNPTSQPNMDPAPEEFDQTVFDKAEKAIKYTVLTNTWRRYVALQ